MAERVGFEPTWDLRPQRISSPRRYVHFGTSPTLLETESHCNQIEPSLGVVGPSQSNVKLNYCNGDSNICNEFLYPLTHEVTPKKPTAVEFYG